MEKNELFKYREYYWDYFSMHADQRLKSFNFYIVVSAVFIGAFVNILNNNNGITLACILPYILSFISFIFWKLDLRTKGMIKIAENAIKIIDDQIVGNEDTDHPNELNIFRYDDYVTSKRCGFKMNFSYSTCLNSIFLAMGLLGFFAGTFYLIDKLICK